MERAPDPGESGIPSLTKRIGSRRLEEKYTEPTRLWLERPAGRRGFFPGYCPCHLPGPAWGNGPWSPSDASWRSFFRLRVRSGRRG